MRLRPVQAGQKRRPRIPFDATGFPSSPPRPERLGSNDSLVTALILVVSFLLMVTPLLMMTPVSLAALADIVRHLQN